VTSLGLLLPVVVLSGCGSGNRVQPTLGVHSPPELQCVDALGFGEARPVTINYCGDPGSVLDDIHWKSWGGRQAVGAGKGAYQGMNGWMPGTATVVAFDLGSCGSKPAYQAMEWYFPADGEHFDPSEYNDLCTNQYVDLTCLSSQEATTVLQHLPRFGDTAVRDVFCDGTAWATGTLTSSTGYEVLGDVAFREASTKWEVVATASSLSNGALIPSGEAAYCRALVEARAPAGVRCDT
jgi:hypothetical protein